MMSFGGSFWSFLNFNQSSQIDSMLSNPETTLDQLLADENILSEFKSLNPKLLDYCTDDRIKQLIRYMIEEPPADADRDRGYKFPFVSCEILTADIETILEAFFGRNPNNLRKHSADSDYSGKAEHHEGEGDDSHEERNIELEKEEEAKETESAEKEGSQKTQKEQKDSNQEEKEKEEKEESTQKEDKQSEQEKAAEVDADKEKDVKASEDLAGYFFSFLDQKELNVTLVGYFSRFLNHIIIRKQNEINQYIWQHPEIVDKFIDHVEQKSIAECLAKLFIIENTSTKTDEFIALKIEKLKKLVNLLSVDTESLNAEAITNLSASLVEIITKKKGLHSEEEYTKYFASEEFLDAVFENMFRDKTLTSNTALIINTLLLNILQGPQTSPDEDSEAHEPDSDSPEKGGPEKKRPEISQEKLYSCLYSKAGDIVEYLDQQPEPKRDSTYGTNEAPLGMARLRLVELVLYALKLNVNKVSSEFALKGVFKVLMRLMTQYEWNNLLHNHIEKIFVSTLESDSHVVRQKLLHNANLLDFLLQSSKEVDYTFPNAQHRKVRKGYLGHLTKIAKLLERLSERDNDIKEYLNNEKWAEFKKNYLQVTLDKDNSDLAKTERKKSDDYASHPIHHGGEKDDEKKNHGGVEDGEDDLNDRDFDDNKGNHGEFESQDVFSKYEGHYEGDWQKEHGSPEKEENRTKIADIWSMGPADFSMTFKFTGFPEIPKEIEPSVFLELNRKQEIIDIGPQHEPALEQAYFDNAYWARPKHQNQHIDDIMKEFES